MVIGVKFNRRSEKYLVILVYMNREEKYKEIIKKWMEENLDWRVIVRGDFNAKTEFEGGIWNQDGNRKERKSGEKVINKERKELDGLIN